MKIIRFEDSVKHNEYVVSVENIILVQDISVQRIYPDGSIMGYRVYIKPMDEYISVSEETYKRLKGELLCEQ